jgi:hypothetical protein
MRAVYVELSDDPLSGNELSRRAGVGNKTGNRNLPKLASFGMAKKLADGWVRGHIPPDDIPGNEGWLEDNSKVEQRRERFTQERAAHKMKLETFARLHPKRRIRMMTPTEQLARLHQGQAAPPTDKTAFGELADIGKLLQDKYVADITERYPALATV